MNVGGMFRLHAPREDVFRAICDPNMLLAVVPGCESVEQIGPDEYAGRITLRLPGVAGGYRTSVRLVDAVPPDRAGLEGRVEGSLGSIEGRADFELREDAGVTILTYQGRAVIQGPLARLDSRFAEGLAQSLIAQGLRALDHRLAAARPTVAAADRRPGTEASE
jgi:carbon monoxide dehydrogenase subunit G